jgi:hypothetical protein
MKMKILGLLAAGLLAGPMAALAGPMTASALSFQFSFTNTIGNIFGSVTGRVLGLIDNTADQAATSVIIDTYPALSGDVPNLDVVTWDVVAVNSFTVVDGQIVSGGIGAQNNTATFANFDTFLIGGVIAFILPCCDAALANNALTFGGAEAVANNDGFQGVTYRAISPVPEPGTVALLSLGLGLAGLGLGRKRKAI